MIFRGRRSSVHGGSVEKEAKVRLYCFYAAMAGSVLDLPACAGRGGSQGADGEQICELNFKEYIGYFLCSPRHSVGRLMMFLRRDARQKVSQDWFSKPVRIVRCQWLMIDACTLWDCP